MKPQTFVRLAAWLLVALVTFVTLSPIELRPVTTAPADLERFAAFAVIGAAFCIGYPQHRLAVILLTMGFIGLLEAGQHLVPGRHGHFHDGVIKVAGMFLG